MMELENETKTTVAEFCESLAVQRKDISTVYHKGSAVRSGKSAENLKQSGFSST